MIITKVPLIASLLFAGTIAASEINIVQTHQGTNFTLVNAGGSEKVATRLGAMPEISLHKGNCEQISRQLRRNVACLSKNKDGNLTLSKPTGTAQREVIQTPFPRSNDEVISASNQLYKFITNSESSPFENKLALVSKRQDGKYIVRTANYDGSGAQILHESDEPILSPSLSPNGRYVAYVSFESVRASIFVHDTKTKRRAKVITLKGLNAYPSFETNSTLLVSISNEKATSEIHRYDIIKDELVRLKTSRTADIFPKSLSGDHYLKVGLSTKDVPYAYSVKNGKQKPISIKPLNAISADENGNVVGLSGHKLVYLKKGDGNWGEMVDIASGRNIESPSISRNGTMIYYSTKEKGRVFIKSTSNKGKNILSFMLTNEDLIQVSAL